MSEQIHYRPEVDGLRAVAVVGVVLYHAGFAVYGGFVGVDVFFVISGYLITSLVLRAMDKETFSLKEFWVRRIRRIFPASIFLLVVLLVVCGLILFPKDYQRFATSVISQCVFAANIYFYRNSNYFDPSSELMPLLHTWSLAVEEQFYLFYPLFIVLISRWVPGRLMTCLVIVALASLALSGIFSATYPGEAFYLLPFRAWELLAGGILAALPPRLKKLDRASGEAVSWIGLMLILYAMLTFNSDTVFPGISAALPVIGAVLVIYGNTGEMTSAGKLLALRPVLFVGLVSYSWYLWHWPIMALMRYTRFEFDRLSGLFAIAVSFVMAVLSWKFIEQPFRRPARAQTSRQVFATAAASMLLLVTVATTITLLRGMPARFSEPAREFIASTEIPTQLQTKHEDPKNFELPILGEPSAAGECFLLWGDSHAIFVAPVLDDLARKFGITGRVATRAGVAPLLETWSEDTPYAVQWNQCVLDYIKRHNIKNVVLAGRWTVKMEPGPDNAGRRMILDAKSVRASAADASRVLLDGLNRTVGALKQLGVRVWIVQEVPLQMCDPARAILTHARWDLGTQSSLADTWYGVTREEHDVHQKLMREVLSQVKNVKFIDATNRCFGDNGRSLMAADGECFYFDDDHLSAVGARFLLSQACLPFFRDITEAEEFRPADTGQTAGLH